jgi:hypothetical protein
VPAHQGLAGTEGDGSAQLRAAAVVEVADDEPEVVAEADVVTAQAVADEPELEATEAPDPGSDGEDRIG